MLTYTFNCSKYTKNVIYILIYLGSMAPLGSNLQSSFLTLPGFDRCVCQQLFRGALLFSPVCRFSAKPPS